MTDIVEGLAVFTSLFMTGLIWFVQLVHYPLFAKVGEEAFVEYEQTHTRLTSYLVAPIMILEFVFGALLLLQNWFDVIHLFAFLMLVICWISTFLVQVPLHNKLNKRREIEDIEKLVRSNWVRTIAWSVRAILLLGLSIRFL